MTWIAFKPWLLMGLIFGAGAVAGASLTVAFRPEAPHGPPGMQQIRSHWLNHLTHELDLTPDQQTKVKPILEKAADEIQSHHREEVDQISKIMDQANEQIALVLTPQQQEILKEIRNERERAFSGHMGRREGSRQPGGEPGFPRGTPPPGAPVQSP